MPTLLPSGSHALRVLAVCGQFPLPPIDGDRIANLGLLSALAKRYPTSCLTIGQPPEEHHLELANMLHGRLTIVPPGPLPSRTRLAAVTRLGRAAAARMPTRYLSRLNDAVPRALGRLEQAHDVVLFIDNYFAPYVHLVHKPVVLHLHQVDGAAVNPTRPGGPIDRLVQRINHGHVLEVEGKAVHAASGVTVTSKEEAVRLATLYGVTPARVVPSTIECPTPITRNVTGPVVGWVGSHHYTPNTSGLRRFLDVAWPLIRSATGAEFWIAGREPPRDILDRHGRDGVKVIGFVQDIATFLSRVSVGVVPLWLGAGLKLKTITMMSHMVPTVSTVVGAEGLEVGSPPELIVVDDLLGMGASVVALLRDVEYAETLGARGRTLVMKNFSPQVAGEAMANVLEEVVTSKLSPPNDYASRD